MRSPEAPRAVLIVALAAILVATLPPVSGRTSVGWEGCVVCGEHGAADVLLNILLFAPLGAALTLSGWPARRSVVTAAVLSAAVEFAQLFIPGRDSSLGDILANTAGGGAGVLLVRTASHWLWPRARAAGWLWLAAATGASGICFLTGLALGPSLPESTYYGQWTPNLGNLEWYRGRVLEATLGGRRIPPQRLADSKQVRRLLLTGDGVLLSVRAIAGPPTSALGPLFSIYDDGQREILLLGPDRDDVVLRLRTRAAALRFDQPDVRLLGALRHIATGDTLAITVRRDRGRQGGGRYCIRVNHAASCDLGPTVGIGWGLLMYPESLPAWLKAVLSVGWVAGLTLPAGFWVRNRAQAIGAAAVLSAGLLAAPALTPLAPTPPGQWVGALGGFLLGLATRVAIGARGAITTSAAGRQ